MKEYIYIMSSPSIPHIVKIGFSTNPEERIKTMSNTSVPFPFKLEKAWEVENGRIMEAELRHKLDFCRIDSQREFYGLSPEKAIEAIENILETGCLERVKVNINKELAYKIKDSKSLGKLIRCERKKQHLTQEHVALACGVGLRVIGEIENGKSTAEIGIVLKIINGLGIQIILHTNNF